jgi:hypothetical protein
MAGLVFNNGAYRLLSGDTVWSTDNIHARLVPTLAADMDIDAMSVDGLGDVTTDIIVDTPVGPEADAAADHVKYYSEDLVFPSVAALVGECNRVIFYHFVSPVDDGDNPVIAVIDITPVTPDGNDITITQNALGWFYAQQHE